MLQAPIFEGLSVDPLALLDDGLCPVEVDIGWRDVVQALEIALTVVMPDERFGLWSDIAGQEVVFQQDAVLQCQMPAFDLTMWMGRHQGTARMAHLLDFDVFRQFARDPAQTIVAEQTYACHTTCVCS